MSQALYQRIAASLRQRILSGGHVTGDVMPSENELSQAYHTSRVTVRKAFQILESEGLIKARQGKGYIVQPPRSSVFTLVFGEESDSYRCLAVDIQLPEPETVRLLGLREGQPVISIRRVLERDGSPVAYDEKYIPYERGRPVVEQELHFSEFPDLLADRFATLSLRTELHIRTAFPPERVRRVLGCRQEKLLTLEKLVLSAEGERLGFGLEYLTPQYGPLKASSGLPPIE